MPEPRDPAAKNYTDREIAHLRDLLEQRIKDCDNACRALIAGSDKAVAIALQEQREKWSAANEFRGTINDYREHTMPRSETMGRLESIEKDIDVLKAFMYAQQGSKTSLLAAVGILLGVIGAGLAIFNTVRLP